ncbi:hypothetical protein KFK09_001603 [Dendrobium nobile]|uniref:Nucleoside phosphorylase domain-containing protein n=1 Tax=Dendrobium nobile TaxID=94219 RepID=A0A8T3C7W3_DENNO|nr:hypothetical protein KFK09_001603 [Dendrobium nobile]
MPSPEETNGEHPSAAIEADATGGADEATRQPISTVVIIIAMQTEALPLVSKFQLSEDTDGILFPKGVPWVRYHGKYKDLNINLVWPGKDLLLGVDSVGTVSASLVTYASIQALKPDLVINAGTAGGFKLGRLSTGDSLDMSPYDEGAILANDAVIKDMEGAAVAYVADLLSVPAIFIKAVTDIIDGEKPTAEEFLQNLVAVTANLDQAVTQAIYFINGRCLSDL